MANYECTVISNYFRVKNPREVISVFQSLGYEESYLDTSNNTVILASYEHDRFNDEKAIFRTFYKVVDVYTHYSENKAYKNLSVQYSVILRKE